ncbi:MAG TPA: hypothetical protein PK443_06470 [bacterium]|nr:hypothetical protein [bacterium]
MKNIFIIVFALSFFATGLMSAPPSTPPSTPSMIELVKWDNVKAPASCTQPKNKHKISDSRYVCFEIDNSLDSMPASFLNCSGNILFFNSSTATCSTTSGKIEIGSADSTYIRSKGSLGAAGYDIFVFGPTNSRYIEFDLVTDFSTYTEAAIVAHRNAKIKAYKDIKACLKKVVSTPSAKCVISSLGVVTE